MKITIYELLGLVKDGKAPKKVFYITHQEYANGYTWTYDEKAKDYMGIDGDYIFTNGNYQILEMLNMEVKILEEEKKIPEKLDIELNSGDENKVNFYTATNLECDLAFKINSIIDYLKSKGE